MALNIKNPEIHELARALAEATGETMTDAVGRALRERLERVRPRGAAGSGSLADRLDAIALHCASLPVIRDRTEDEIFGYDERGMPS
jgi:antitoxin VapB